MTEGGTLGKPLPRNVFSSLNCLGVGAGIVCLAMISAHTHLTCFVLPRLKYVKRNIIKVVLILLLNYLNATSGVFDFGKESLGFMKGLIHRTKKCYEIFLPRHFDVPHTILRL